MPPDEERFIFQQSPVVTFGGNKFVNVPVILQYDETPLIQVLREVQAGFTIEIPIYNRDGVYLAKVKGSRLFLTSDGEKAGLKLRHPDKRTVCELGGQTLFELERQDAAALKTSAELFTPDGAFVKVTSTHLPTTLLKADQTALRLGGIIMQGNMFNGMRIGILVRSNGSIAIGVNSTELRRGPT